MLIRSEAGTLVGGGPRTFQKYEAGELLPSRAISSALMLLDHDPASLAVLRGRIGRGRDHRPADRHADV
jgi:HTH-type transcriptional regulator / antitoxin MqsA